MPILSPTTHQRDCRILEAARETECNQEGVANTAFHHAQATQRLRRNHIGKMTKVLFGCIKFLRNRFIEIEMILNISVYYSVYIN
jgi:hypothetical protein